MSGLETRERKKLGRLLVQTYQALTTSDVLRFRVLGYTTEVSPFDWRQLKLIDVLLNELFADRVSMKKFLPVRFGVFADFCPQGTVDTTPPAVIRKSIGRILVRRIAYFHNLSRTLLAGVNAVKRCS
jgi:hypothetical protein